MGDTRVGRCEVLVICLTAIAGLLRAPQGWRTRFVTWDLVILLESAHKFVTAGHIPFQGCLNGFVTYIPPGTNWLLVPGVILFDDPRLFQSVGAATLYLGTLAGMCLLARSYCGSWCGVLSVVLYSTSAFGLLFAISLWPRGHFCRR